MGFVEKHNATAVGLLAVSLMLALHAVPWKTLRATTAPRTPREPRHAGGHTNGLTCPALRIDWFAIVP
ncbi:hypothetical protein KCP73_04380 [Salmonella enterica subsp. enterica]|nr:hypothetical protein KCP73_04380 [Salmonella enterica subsp. enterica]